MIYLSISKSQASYTLKLYDEFLINSRNILSLLTQKIFTFIKVKFDF